MKRFIKNLSAFTFPILVICLLADFWITNIVTQPPHVSNFDLKIQQILNEKNRKYQVLIFGDSRAESHISPQKIIEYTGLTCKNNGFYGQDIYGIQQFVNFTNLDSAKLILLNISVYNFYDTKAFDTVFNQHFIVNIFSNYWLLNKLNGKHFFDIVLPMVRYTRKLPLYFAPKFIDTASFKQNGLISLRSFESSNKKDFFVIKDKLDWQDAIQKKGMQEMFNILKLCHQKNIIPVIVFSPYFYLEDKYDFKTNSKLFFSHLKDTLQKNKIKVLDYYADSVFNNQNLFFNWGHLNNIGEDILSDKIAKQVVQILNSNRSN